MARDPAFLFYSNDFLASTRLMSYAQAGQYITLLCLQHQNGHLSEETMTDVMGEKFDEKVARKFLVDENGCYYNEDLDKEANRRKQYSASRSKNRSSNNICKTYDKDMNDICTSHDEHMETVTIYTNSTDNKTNKPISNTVSIPKRFELLWALYPKKQGKTDALNAYKRALKDDVTDEQIKAGIEAYVAYLKARGTEDKYIKQGGTFFNQRGWVDDYAIKEGGYGRGSVVGRADRGDDDGEFPLSKYGGLVL